MSERTYYIGIGIWTFISLLLPLLNTGLNADMVTRLLVLTYFGVLLFWYRRYGSQFTVWRPKMVFVLFASLNALVVEIFHMFSRPLVSELRISMEMPVSEMLKNTFIDLVLTFPAYLVIFSVMWVLMTRYRYSALAFFVVMSLGQALGDGNAFFLANPVMLIFVPYVMLNYWAMNLIPFLLVRNNLPPPVSTSKVGSFLIPLIVLPLTYLAMGLSIFTAGKILGLLP